MTARSGGTVGPGGRDGQCGQHFPTRESRGDVAAGHVWPRAPPVTDSVLVAGVFDQYLFQACALGERHSSRDDSTGWGAPREAQADGQRQQAQEQADTAGK